MTEPDGPPAFDRVLAARRMCRDYLDRPVDPGVLDTVLSAAFRGPAAGNAEALDLVVLQGPDVDRYWALTLPATRRDSFPWPGLLRAPVLVLPYVDPDAYVARYARPDKAGTGLGAGQDRWAVPYWWVDGGAAVMAMLLSAEAHGLGALFFGQFDHEPAVAAAFGVPDGHRAVGSIALGHRGDHDRPSASSLDGRPAPGPHVRHGTWSGSAAARAVQR